MTNNPLILAVFSLVVAPLALHAHPGDMHGHHHKTKPGLHRTPDGLPTVIGGVPESSFPVYRNLDTTGMQFGVPNTFMIADNLHMVSGGDMVAFSFMYGYSQMFCAGHWSGDATVRFYENDANNTLLPSASTLLGEFTVPIVGDGSPSYIRHFELTAPLTLPPSIWMGVEFDWNIIGGSGLLTAAANPEIGSSMDAHFISGGVGYMSNPHGAVYANYAFAVYIPAPGAAALLALAALAGTRRRR